MIYDAFYVCTGNSNSQELSSLKKMCPAIQVLHDVKSFSDISDRSFTKMFWVIWDDLLVDTNFDFNYSASVWDQAYIHVFKNGKYYDGICLIPKNANCSQREFENRFFIDNKKEVAITASEPKPFDIIFISYDELNATIMYNKLLKRFPRAKRIHGVKGIHNAHIEAAKLSDTSMFWVVDADSEIIEDFDFTIEQIPYYSKQAWIELLKTVHVWRSRNPINDLEYGYGGVKLLPKTLTMSMDTSTLDMTTSISKSFKVMDSVSNVTVFNTDPFSTWKSAFRECVKLSSGIIDRQNNTESMERLTIWKSTGGSSQYGSYAISGAINGDRYGELHKNDLEALTKINDFEWLKSEFQKHHE
jgi:hypothetical protein